ncbi:MAG: lytic transglycosylase domain-containing protein [Candidatus Latescibacteria bacterium]|nr:lytic transglycosylase domain-containing protein [Candidatus Latescibacterota bacterium]
MRYKRMESNRFTAIGKLLILAGNIMILAVAVRVVDGAFVEPERAPVRVEPPREALLPYMTITNEIKVGMFYDGLRIDQSYIDPQEITKSISPWEPYIIRYSRQHGVDADLVRAIIYAESKGDPFSISRDGAVGLMQIMPATANHFGIDSLLEPEQNIKAGVMYISWLTKYYGEDHVLWAWNAGPGKTRKNLMPRETKRFIVEVISIKTYLKDDAARTI